MAHKTDISRRDFIKSVAGFVGMLIGIGIGLPSILYLLSPSLEKTQDDLIIDLGSLERYPIGIPTRFEFTRTRVNGWERTATNYGLFVLRKSESEVRVFSDICTHLGCSPTFRPDVAPADLGPAWKGGFFCPCHGSRFDLAGRVYKSVPAPLNLEVPSYRYMTDSRVLIGVDPETA